MSSKLTGILGVLLQRLPAHNPKRSNTHFGFGLASFRPYLTADKYGMPWVNFNKQFVFPAQIKTVAQANVGSAKWGREKYGCADDICMLAHIMSSSMEVKAAGSEQTIKAALLEASRYYEAEQVKYITFRYLIQAAKGENAIVLENLVAPHGADKAIVVTLDIPFWQRAPSSSPLLLA